MVMMMMMMIIIIINTKLKKTMTRLSFYDYSDGYILVKGTIAVPDRLAVGLALNNTNK